MNSKTVVIGIGNILLGDEGVGVRIVEELKKFEMPEGVEIHDGATSGIAILNFLNNSDKAIIVDAVRGGGEPGTVYRFGIEEAVNKPEMCSLHDIDFIMAYRVSKDILNLTEDITILGIEPYSIENGFELSEPVEKAVPEVINLIMEEIRGPKPN